MNENILLLVQPQWRAAFAEFVETGEASQTFLDYLQTDDDALHAADLVFVEQIGELQHLTAELLPASAAP